MKPALAVLALLVCTTAKADQTLVVDIGAPVPFDVEVGFQQSFPINLTGTPVDGEQDKITITFPNGEFISHDFFIDTELKMSTNGPGCAGFTSGIGYFTGKDGEPLQPPVTLGNACGSDGSLATGIENAVVPLFPPETNSLLGTSQDIYGFVFDLFFPDETNVQVTGANLLVDYMGVTVPEPSVLSLLVLGLVGVALRRKLGTNC